MMLVKRLLVMLLAAALLTSCGTVKDSDDDEPSTAAETTTAAESTTEAEKVSVIEFRRGDSADSEVVLTNDDIAAAYMMLVQNTEGGHEYCVRIDLDEEGKRRFADLTAELAGSDTPVSIWVDGEIVSAPMVNSAITDGQAVISGNFTEDSAQELADNINAGIKEDE